MERNYVRRGLAVLGAAWGGKLTRVLYVREWGRFPSGGLGSHSEQVAEEVLRLGERVASAQTLANKRERC